MKATSMNNIWAEMLGDIDGTTDKTYPFEVRVGCVKMAPPRHERFEYLIEMGHGNIDRVFNGQPFNDDSLVFAFPERYMSVHEQQGFMSVLKNHPHVDEIKSVLMITSSPLLIGNFSARTIRILTWPDDEDYNGESKW